MKVYIIWFIGVIIWNFGFPNATPTADVIVAVFLSFLSMGLKNFKTLINQQKNKYFGSKL